MVPYGKRLQQLRTAAGLTQPQLAEKLESDQRNISYWERSFYPPLEAIETVCHALGVPLSVFFLTEQEAHEKFQVSGDVLRTAKVIESLPSTARHFVIGFVELAKKYTTDHPEAFPDLPVEEGIVD